VALGGVLVTLLAVVVLILATAGDTQPPPAAGCIRVQVAGRVGGELIHACGKEAEAICARATRFDDPRGRKVVESCRERGIRF
jgi:hypothetical protein